MFSFLKKFRRDDKGATMIEYGLIAAIVAVATIGTLTTMATGLKDTFTKVNTELAKAK